MRLPLAGKLIGIGGIVLATVATILTIEFFAIRGLQVHFNEAADVAIPKLGISAQIINTWQRSIISAIKYSADGEPFFRDESLASIDAAAAHLKSYETVVGTADRATVDKVRLALEFLRNDVAELFRAYDAVKVDRSDAVLEARLNILRTKVANSEVAAKGLLEATTAARSQLESLQGLLNQRVERDLVLTSSLAVALSVILVVVGLLLYRSIVRPLRLLREGAAAVAAGNFTLQIPLASGDEFSELARTFETMGEAVKRRTSVILENIGEGMLVTDRNGRLTLANRAALNLLGKKWEEVIGMRAEDIIKLEAEEDAEPVDLMAKLFTPLSREKKIIRLSRLFLKRSNGGDRTPTAVMGASIVDVTGAYVASVLTIQDLTEEYRLEQVKTDFISITSHQLRTPLTSMRWILEILLSGREGRMSSEQESSLKDIYGATMRLITLINALLNISRLEEGRVAVQPVETDLIELTRSITRELQPIIDHKDQSFTLVEPEKPLPLLALDPLLVRQVIINLISNATRYTPRGGAIDITFREDGNFVSFTIRDTGIGIPQAEQKRVFKKFFRAENAMMAEPEGTGLGLAISKHIVESWRGTLTFSSQEGKGTTFTFTVPRQGMRKREGEVSLVSLL